MDVISTLVVLLVTIQDCVALHAALGDTVKLTCESQIDYPSWLQRDPIDPVVSILINFEGLPGFNPRLPAGKADRLRWDVNKINLWIDNITRADNLSYECSGVPGHATVVNLTVRVPATLEVPDTSEGTEDTEVTITCKSSGGYPKQTVEWFRKIVGSTPLNSAKEEVNDTATNTWNITQTLKFIPRAADDSVVYICQSSFQDDPKLTVTKTTTLQLSLKPSDPNFTTLGDLKEGVNSSVARCFTSGFRPSNSFNLTWIIRGKNTTSWETPVVDPVTKTYNVAAVFWKQVTRDDNGQNLICSVDHQTLTKPRTASIKMNVKYRPLFTNLTGNKQIVADGATKLTLTCTSGTSNPVSTMSWKVNSNISQEEVASDELDGDYAGRRIQQQLTLKPTRVNDGTTVTCEAHNDVSEGRLASNSTVLDLLYGPLIYTLSNVTVVEGNYSLLVCSVSSKPPSMLRWYKEGVSQALSTGTDTFNTLTYNISNVGRTHAGTYRCNAKNGIETEDNKRLNLMVLYPPNVTVELQNTSVKDNQTTLKCIAKGMPDTGYVYGKWLQEWPGYGYVLERGGIQSLSLSHLTYEYTGIYKCSASNSIKEFGSPEEFKEGSAFLLVKSAPVITNANVSNTLKIPGKLSKFSSTVVEFYTYIDSFEITCYRVLNGIRGTKFACLSSVKDTKVNLQVHSHIVQTAGKSSIITIPINTTNDFGLYDIVVANEEDTSEMKLEIVPEGPPNVPTDINIEEVHQTGVQITWLPGFYGGFDQTFVVQISTDGENWINKTKIFWGKSETKATATLKDLTASKLHFLRVFAFNKEGRSNFTNTVNFTTPMTGYPSTPSGALLGGVIGGVAGFLAILSVVIVLLIRRQRIKKGTDTGRLAVNTKRKQETEEDSSDEDVVVENKMYESAGQMTRDEPVYNKPTKKVKVDTKSTDVYAVVDKNKKKEKQKVKKTKTQQGDIYENAPEKSIPCNNTYGNAAFDDNLYENRDGSKSTKTPKKNINQEGLIYADLAFNDQPKGQKKLVIHGLDEMTTYVQVDFNKKADPLPDSDTEEHSANKKN